MGPLHNGPNPADPNTVAVRLGETRKSERAAPRPAGLRVIGIYSFIAVVVVLGLTLFISQRALTPSPGAASVPSASAPPVSTPAVSDPAVSGATYRKVPNQVLFALDSSGDPNISGNLANISQGDTGDCYFLAALLTVAARAPDTVLNMVHDNGNGTFTVSFHSKYDGVPNPVKVTVSGDLPYSDGKPLQNEIQNIGGKNVSWAAIIEKGWAAVNGNSYKGIEGTDLSNAQDRDVHNALYAITGKVPVDRNPGGPMTGVSFAQMQQDFTNGLVALGTSNADGKLVPNHAYALLGVNAADRTVLVGDPAGDQTTMKFSTFRSTNINQYIAIPTHP